MSTHTQLQQRFEARLAEILGRVRRIEEDLRKTPERDWTEQAAATEDDQVLGGLDDLARAEADAIRLALRRITAGEYGVCSECHQPIDENRLAAAPTAARCINCAG